MQTTKTWRYRRHLLCIGRILILLGLATGLASLMACTTPRQTISSTLCNAKGLTDTIGTAKPYTTLTFDCDTTITLESTLIINKSVTLDGGTHHVTLQGRNAGVLQVSKGVFLGLKHLTIARGTTVSGSGGGVDNEGGAVTISNSNFAYNSAASGGGLYNSLGGTVTISNSTFAFNSATRSVGGGIYNMRGAVTISNSTFAFNSAASGDGAGLNNYAKNGATMRIRGSIVANNTVTSPTGTPRHNCSAPVASSGKIPIPSVSDQGYNLESGSDCGFTSTGSLQNKDPQLATTLADFGATTQTLALAPTSPAINGVPSSACADVSGSPVSTDQRGFTRPQGAACDLGAFEFRVPTLNPMADITTNATQPTGAVVVYNATGIYPDDALTFPSVECDTPSNVVFPITVTTVNCTARGPAGNESKKGSFTVTVKGVKDQLEDLQTLVTVDSTLAASLKKNALADLASALDAWGKGDTKNACSSLSSFIREAAALPNLVAQAKNIQAVIGC